MARKINAIVVHHSCSTRISTTVGDIKKWHTKPPIIDPKTGKKIGGGNGWAHIGYHRVIQFDGIVAHTLSLEKEGFGVWGKNANTIHICVVGNFEYENPTKKQLASIESEGTKLCNRFELISDCIYGHGEYATESHPTACPGKNLIDRLKEIKKLVALNLAVDAEKEPGLSGMIPVIQTKPESWWIKLWNMILNFLKLKK